MKRRSFLATSSIVALAPQSTQAAANRRVRAMGDGLHHTPEEYASLLQRLSASIEADDYSLGGVVGRLEEKIAAALGKETAVWMPTGTLANHVAVRLLAGDKRRVLVQQECHLYNDCGDCCQTLSGLHLVPLAPGKATFTLEDVQHEVERAASGRVAVPIGAIQMETPVRRKMGEAFNPGEMNRIARWARERQIGLHLDGARLFLAAAYSGVPLREYAGMFDTVYVSMYKYFNAASGAVLAGPRKLLGGLFHTRRMFGGGLSHVWPFAAVALHYFDGFPDRFRQAVAASEKVIAELQQDSRMEITRIPNGTNIFSLRVKGVQADGFRQRAQAAGITLAAPDRDRFLLSVNETWNFLPPHEISHALRSALG